MAHITSLCATRSRALLLSATLAALIAALLALLTGCMVPEPAFTEPCSENCNASAIIGAGCAAAEDCAEGMFCSLDYPGGYCHVACDEGAAINDACGPDDTGLCQPGAEDLTLCYGECDPSDPESCGREESVCYAAGEEGQGICFVRCDSDADCGGSMACDGTGVCRSPVATCDAMTHQGCASGMSCLFSTTVGPFCGVAGTARTNDACDGANDCEEGLWCVDSACRPLCDVDDFNSCSGAPGNCQPVQRGGRLGVCLR